MLCFVGPLHNVVYLWASLQTVAKITRALIVLLCCIISDGTIYRTYIRSDVQLSLYPHLIYRN